MVHRTREWQEEKRQSACKPGSVWLRPVEDRNVAAIHLGRRSRAASCNPPG